MSGRTSNRIYRRGARCQYCRRKRTFFPAICWTGRSTRLLARASFIELAGGSSIRVHVRKKAWHGTCCIAKSRFIYRSCSGRLLIRGRPVYSHVPLFSGYIFVHGTPEDRLRTLMTNRVAQVFPVEDGERLQIDLRSIQRLIEAGAPLTVESRLEANQPVRVRAGALAGMEGTVVKRKNETRLLVWVKMLQQGVSLEIEDYLLEPLA